jgi:carbamoyltransferase
LSGYIALRGSAFSSYSFGAYLRPEANGHSLKLPEYGPKIDVRPYLLQDGQSHEILQDRIDLANRFFAQATRTNEANIRHVNHQICHALSTLPFLDGRSDRHLIFSLDGWGDELCASVSIHDGGQLKVLRLTPAAASIGMIYSRVTGLLGLRMHEHEYKLMGLSPYAHRGLSERLGLEFEKILSVDDDGNWVLHVEPAMRNQAVDELAQHQRFDILAGAVQTYLERMLSKWVRVWVRKTGIQEIALAGGVFMNVKANMHLLEMDDVASIFITPSAGDESTAIGAAVMGALSAGARILPANSLYLGRSFDDHHVQCALRESAAANRYEIFEPKCPEEAAAEILSNGHAIANFTGRSEFGARALGNRSILADPRDPSVIRFLNEAVKSRDFWMPFAPSILEERSEDYLINPKGAHSPFMMLGFATTELARRHIPAALHPYDFTARPQFVSRDAAPSYHALIRAFEKRTGVGGVLNTSFNLHGEPIVDTPMDAIDVMDRCGLTHLRLESYILRKKAD